ncbi:MAG: PIN domain-containing protein, partial [Candidatus Margulisiibacteriota bacterium]
MVFDTDILIWVGRGNQKAAKAVSSATQRYMSIMTRMELVQGAKNKTHLSQIESFITDYDFVVLPLTENIGHRALIYIEEYALGHGVKANDAVIAATAAENNLPLCSS